MKISPSSLCCCALLATLALASAADAADIYQWKDDKGRTQMSDSVPDKYKSVARRVDSRVFDVDPQDKAAADKRAANARAQADAIEAGRKRAEARRREPRADSPAAAPAAIRSANSPDAVAASCAALRREFAASKECYARFTLVDGAHRPGAEQACGPSLIDPDVRCGAQGPSP